MMRAMDLVVAPKAPGNLVAAVTGTGPNQRVQLTWTDNSLNETSFTIQSAIGTGPWTTVSTVASTTGAQSGGTVTVTGLTQPSLTTYNYRVIANKVVGYTRTFVAPAVGYPTSTAVSAPSNTASATTN